MDEELRYLRTPPESGASTPPARTAHQVLPFEQLNPRDFERLCLRLADDEGQVEHAQLYGVPGQKQDGIDVYARRTDGTYVVYQARRVEAFTPGEVKAVVDDFLAGEWAKRADQLVLCTRASLERTELATAIEEGNKRLRRRKKSFVAWDQNRLSTKLKARPDLVLDFFDHAWLEAFCPDAVALLEHRLGAQELRDLRTQLARLYTHVFERRDAAVTLDLAGSSAWTRFVVPDVIDRRDLPNLPPMIREQSAPTTGESQTGAAGPAGTRSIEQRLSLDEWLTSVRQHVLAAEAGGGKSSILQFVALDLLADKPRLGELIGRFDAYLPVWLPFGFWADRVRRGQSSSFTDTIHAWLRAYDEERLWPLVERGLQDGRLILLIDGLDEWGDAASAEQALDHLQVFVQQRDLPLIAAGRPSAIEELGPFPRQWERASIAPLTTEQQREIAAALVTVHKAGSFFRAIEPSGDLRVLAATPLLLILLLWLYDRSVDLPTNRFAAYRAVVDYLIRDHPKRRERKEPAPLDDLDLRAALAALAYAMQEAGVLVMNRQQARAHVAAHLADGTYGLGLAGVDGRRKALEVIDDARERLGILVDVGDDGMAFVHRSLQEHLAACHLSARPHEGQVEAINTRAVDTAWREVLLNLLALTDSRLNGDKLITAISEGKSSAEQWLLAPLVAEVAVGPFNASDEVRRELLDRVIDVVETAPASSVREETLSRLIQSLDHSSLFLGHLRTWLPCLRSRRDVLLWEMAKWPAEEATDRAIWRGLFDEDSSTSRGASHAYTERFAGDKSAATRLVQHLEHPLEPQSRAAMLEALARGWPDSPTLRSFMADAYRSIDPDLRLVAHAWRIDRGEQEEEDLDDVLRRASQGAGVDFHRKGDIANLLIRGWPRSERVRDIALATSHSQTSTRELEFDIALTVLLAGYGDDPKVIEFCRQEIETDDHPFLMLHIDAWRLLAANFRDQPALVSAIDTWLPKQQFQEPEISYAALVGRTEVGKQVLIDRISESSFPFWLGLGAPRGLGNERCRGQPRAA